ncbi:DUF835 domain-containing protein [Candidatus Woesearchaeota archaeon]|nr:DUF835 domain-containing protein [Candidatus Woesearchaeota archaeon]
MRDNKIVVLSLLSLIMIAVVISMNYVSFSKINDVMVDQLMEKQVIETEHSARRIEAHILQVKDELVTLTRFPNIESYDIEGCDGSMALIDQNIEGKIDNILKVSSEGDILECSSAEYQHLLNLNIKNKDYFFLPKETKKPFITTQTQLDSSQIIITAPIFQSETITPYPNFLGEFKGVLMSVVEMEKVYNLYLHPFINEDTSYYILHEDQKTIHKSPGIKDYIEFEGFADVKTNTINSFEDFGETIITTSSIYLGSQKWELIVLTPLDKISKDIQSVQKRHLLSLAFVVVIIILILLSLLSLLKSKQIVEEKLSKAQITLEKLGISSEAESRGFNQADIELKPGKVYFIKEDEENHAHELFISGLSKGFIGLGIIRQEPGVFKKKYDLKKTSFIRLSKKKSQGHETNIENIVEIISQFIERNTKSIILIDRLDFLIAENGFDKVLKNIYELKDKVSDRQAVIILHADPEILQTPQLAALEAETVDIYGKHLKKRINLTEQELGILRHINDNNKINKLVSFKEITDKFNITKPTTRSRVRKLQELGLLQVEQRGRFKSLKITSSGRKII